MTRQSIAELNGIEPALQMRPEVLHLRLHHYMQARKWACAYRISRKLCQVLPDCGTGYLHGGFCLHRMGRTAAARKLLLKGEALLRDDPIFYYNMGCYEAMLGNLRDARVHLEISFEMDNAFREIARRDPDLEEVRELL